MAAPVTDESGPALPGFGARRGQGVSIGQSPNQSMAAIPPEASFPPAITLAPASTLAPGGQRVAILAPLTGPNAERGQALVRAAQLALAEPGAPALDVLDTGGTPAGAAQAAQAAIAQGAGLILGPLTAAETAAAARPASSAGVALLAFTSDTAQSAPLVWVLGLTPAQQVRRLVAAAGAQSKQHFAALLPATEYGAALGTALTQTLAASGGQGPDIRTVEGDIQAANALVREMSGFAARRGPLEAQVRAARARQTAEGRKEAAELSRRPIPPPPFDALLLGDTRERLASIASLLPYYDIDPPPCASWARRFGPIRPSAAGRICSAPGMPPPTPPPGPGLIGTIPPNMAPRPPVWPISPMTPPPSPGWWRVRAGSPPPPSPAPPGSSASTACWRCNKMAPCAGVWPCLKFSAGARR
jgi:hypothetical protein